MEHFSIILKKVTLDIFEIECNIAFMDAVGTIGNNHTKA